MTPSIRLVWRCDRCDRPIDDGDGSFHVDAGAAAAGVHVSWSVMHDRCEPDLDAPGYWFDVDQCRTVDALVRQGAYLRAKGWLGVTDWDRTVLVRLLASC